MTRKRMKGFRIARRLAVLLAAAPLFQFSQCATFSRQVGGTFVNQLPSTFFNFSQQISLIPVQLLLFGDFFNNTNIPGGQGGTGSGGGV